MSGLAIDSAAIAARFPELAPEAAHRIATWTRVLDVWQRAQRLVGWGSAALLLERGIGDALALLPWHGLARGPRVDVGSGAGLPALILAACEPDRDTLLIEARRKRAAFLRAAIAEMGLLRVRVLHARSSDVRDEIPPGCVLTARAFAAPLDVLVEAADSRAAHVLLTSSPARFPAEWPPPGWVVRDRVAGRAERREWLSRG